MEKLKGEIHAINCRYMDFHVLSDDGLRKQMASYEKIIKESKDREKVLEELAIDVFALLKETLRRLSFRDLKVQATQKDIYLAQHFDFVGIQEEKAIWHRKWEVEGQQSEWNMVYYDEQLMGGLSLHRGYAVQMATGEGKTLTATLPAFLHAMTHEGVHIMTTNQYLSRRDMQQTRPLYMFYGLSVGSNWSFNKKEAYSCDVTFGPIREFVFDYLRDRLVKDVSEKVQSYHEFAIIDEIDSILIDSAKTPYIIGTSSLEDATIYSKTDSVVTDFLKSDRSMFSSDIHTKDVLITESGKKWLRNKTGCSELFVYNRKYQIPDYLTLSYVEKKKWNDTLKFQNAIYASLEAHTVYIKDVDYIIKEGSIVIVDANTGRPLPSSRWEYGIHEAVEAKEKLDIKPSLRTSAVISLKNYMRLYKKKAGMSGTVSKISCYLEEIYGMNCISIPTHRPLIRKDYPLRIFKNYNDKWNAIIDYVCRIHEEGRPILIGCSSVKESKDMAEALIKRSLDFNLINAVNENREAYFVSQAGIENHITIGTSMAGRGTDIKLSLNAKEKGGLVVIGTNPFSSVRIDNQLKGRAGRQGDPGSSQFFASLDDSIVGCLSAELREELMDKSVKIDSFELPSSFESYFEKAQQLSEEKFIRDCLATERKDDVLAPYRISHYTERDRILKDDDFALVTYERLWKRKEDMDMNILRMKSMHKLASNMIHSFAEINKRLDVFDIPFSFHQNLYTISFRVSDQYSDLRKFIIELVRQLKLKILDLSWSKFLVYYMEKLDDYEINKIPKKIMEEKTKDNRLLALALRYSTIPITPPDDSYVADKGHDARCRHRRRNRR